MSRWGALFVVVAVVTGCNAEEVLSFDGNDAGTPYTEVGPNEDAAPVDATLGLDATPFPQDGLDADRFLHPNRGDATRDVAPDAGADTDAQGPSLGQCRTESDCARVGLHCSLADASAGACVACTSNSDCPDPALSICDLTLNRCVQCDVVGDCRANEVCLADVTHTCIPSCLNMQACPPRASYCDPTRNVCLGCRNDGDCDVGQICDLTSGRCGECSADTDCHRKPFVKCDRITSHCVECLRNSDCGRGVCDVLGSCLGSSLPSIATMGKGDE